MRDEKLIGLGFMVILLAVITGIVKLIQRDQAKHSVVVILLLFPFLFIMWINLSENGVPTSLNSISSNLVIGVIASLIAAIIMFGLRSK